MKNGCMRVTSRGFTLVEIVVALSIIALMTAIVVPRIRRSYIPTRDHIRWELNNLARIAYTNALMTGKLHRIFFDFNERKAFIEIDKNKSDSQGKPQFEPLQIPFLRTTWSWDKRLSVERFEIQGKNIMRSGEVMTDAGWFFILPDGLAQELTVSMRVEESQQVYALRINPFTVQFAEI